MNRKLITFVLPFTAIFWGSANAGDVTIPNAFQSNTPARASEMNENFSAVKSAVDDNDSRISINTSNGIQNTDDVATNTAAISAFSGGLSVYANGMRIGYFLGLTGYYSDSVQVLTSSGYFVTIYHSGGVVDSTDYLGYVGVDCSGQAYVRNTRNFEAYGEVTKGYNNKSLYLTKGATSTNITLASTGGDSTCRNYDTPTTYDAFPLLSNDEAVTGVPDSGFTGPITFGP